MAHRLQFSLRTALALVFVIALVAWPTSTWLRTYLANRGLVPVTGRVTFKGQPLQDAKVVMVPRGGGKPVEGVTDATGAYELGRPAKPGDYAVGITENGRVKRGLSPKFADGSMSGLPVCVRDSGMNTFDFDLSD